MAAVLAEIEEGEFLEDVAPKHGVDPRTLRRWKDEDEKFRPAYARAREGQATAFVRKAVGVVKTAVDKDSAACAKVQADLYMRVAGRIDPKHWAERQNVDVTTAGKEIKSQVVVFGERRIEF